MSEREIEGPGPDRSASHIGPCCSCTDEYDVLISKQKKLLTGVVNALKGPPPDLTWWSHHDAPELAQAEHAARLAAEEARDRTEVAHRGSEAQINRLTEEVISERLAAEKARLAIREYLDGNGGIDKLRSVLGPEP